jgi:2-polyprenyl-3-methyl-5-hydroxy-6-metoxy-1,4-benzoquinol methylase
VITQDVMEHVFDPHHAFKEIARTLKPGGLHIFTTPIYGMPRSRVRARVRDGQSNTWPIPSTTATP